MQMKIHKSPLFRFFVPTVIGLIVGLLFRFTDLASHLPFMWDIWLTTPAIMVAAGLPRDHLEFMFFLEICQWTFFGMCIGTCWLFFGKADGVRWHTWAKRILLGLGLFVILVSVASFLYFGLYNPNHWDHVVSSPNITGPEAMAGVSKFIAAYGWNMSTNEDDLWSWEDLNPCYIHDLPWKKYKDQQFQALTCNGILYVLSNPGWHHDYAGVAYNPTTNQFPARMDGFKPIGGHWYVWCNLEFHPSDLPKKYE